MTLGVRKLAQQMLDKVQYTPWECTASDVRTLACELISLADECDEIDRKYSESVMGSIKHNEVMMGNLLTFALQTAKG